MIYFRYICHKLIGLIALLLVNSVVASSKNPSQELLIGVWDGTLGKQKIMACWDKYGGQYYYLKKLESIALSLEKPGSKIWLEKHGDKTTGSWLIENITSTYITGNWTKPSSDMKLPIRLNRVKTVKPDKDDFQECNFYGALGSAFHAPIINAKKIQKELSKSFMGRQYRLITALDRTVASVELIGGSKQFTKINKMFLEDLRGDIFGSLTCNVNDNSPADFHTKIKLRFWNDDWLTWSSHDEGYCGGAHPFVGFSTTTINLRTGKEVNIWDWFKHIPKQEDNPNQVCEFLKNRCLPTKLAKRIIKVRATHDAEGNECDEFEDNDEDGGGYDIGLNEKGIAFIPYLVEPARGFRTCYGRYIIPYAELAPYLNKRGLMSLTKLSSP